MSLDTEILPRDHAALTPSDVTIYGDSATWPRMFSALWCPTVGTVVVKSPKGTLATYTIPVAGVMLYVAGSQLRAASTCTGVVALFGTP